MYILNEEEFIRDTLASRKKPKDISISYLISLTAKYYYLNNPDIDRQILIDTVKKKIREFKILGYQEHRYFNKIVQACDNAINSEIDNLFRRIEYIPIYESDISKIMKLNNNQEKKFMFTVYALARYMNCGGWINKKDYKSFSEVFELANIASSISCRNEMIHKLYENNFIELSRKIDNLNIRVNLINDGEVAYKIKKFENLGNQYLCQFEKRYKFCATPGCTGKVVITGKNSKYCYQCARERKLMKYKKYNEKR